MRKSRKILVRFLAEELSRYTVCGHMLLLEWRKEALIGLTPINALLQLANKYLFNTVWTREPQGERGDYLFPRRRALIRGIYKTRNAHWWNARVACKLTPLSLRGSLVWTDLCFK